MKGLSLALLQLCCLPYRQSHRRRDSNAICQTVSSPKGGICHHFQMP
jgi:hypothetical protein